VRLGSPLVLCYHALSRDWPADLAIAPQRLREQLTYLVRRGYRGATFGEVIRGEAPRKAVVVTFDDAFRSVIDRGLPILDELGLPATVFVPTDLPDQLPPMAWDGIAQWVGTAYEKELSCMSWEELRRLSELGWEIGSHTKRHPRLPELDDRALGAELAESREACTREIGAPCEMLAYPYGAHDARVRAAARDAGYAAACALEMCKAEPYNWPRVGVYSIDDLPRFRVKVSPAVRALRSLRVARALESLTSRSEYASPW
jgi:peptidoglycan/xylan/chitin deacetylase (PgdA/CDA1 family)